MKTFHIITAKYLPLTDTKPVRFVLHSARFNQRVIIPISPKYGTGVEWLKKHGFDIVGTGYIENRVVIVTDTFKPLKDEKQENRSRT